MTYIPFLFNQTIEQMRRIGSRGGKTHARNWRARQHAAGDGQRDTPMPAAAPQETTTQAIEVLDAQFAWLRGAEKPVRQRRNRAAQLSSSLVSPKGTLCVYPAVPAIMAGYLPLPIELVERFKVWQVEYDRHEPWAPEKFDWRRHARVADGLARDLKPCVAPEFTSSIVNWSSC